ncbi:MAG: hypothetical protein PHG47_08520 [Sulfuricella sp.]|nr:hypothetical protein [Sulfuricella sp.]
MTPDQTQTGRCTEAFDTVLELELNERIIARRRQAYPETPELHDGRDAVGLGLSGGGVRSATFNLGLLQAFQRFQFLKHVDYLSTVSGGGYIGSSLTWFMSRLKLAFPFGAQRKDYCRTSNVLHWLRVHGNYLTPGGGLTIWNLIAAILSGIVINLLVLAPVFLVVLTLLSRQINWCGGSGFDCLLYLGGILLATFLLYSVISALTSGLPSVRGYRAQREKSELTGKLLMLGVALVVAGSIPHVSGYLHASLLPWLDKTVRPAISLAGLAALIGAWRSRKDGNETQGIRSVFLSLGLGLLIYGLTLWGYHAVSGCGSMPTWLYWSLALSLVLAIFANVNHVSMHRYYRDRLMETYLPYNLESLGLGKDLSVSAADSCDLGSIEQTIAPYHIINANANMVGSKNPKLKGRGGDNFILSPLFCGASSTGYQRTADYAGGRMNLSTAFAISGAAVDPNTYATRSRPLTFLMTLFNVRLGYWARNPKRPPGRLGYLFRPSWYWYMFTEMLGNGMNENHKYIHLSDGGHFENLGLYELIRRRCRYIVIADASADPDWNFDDLARVIRLVRVDFGAAIDLDISPLLPQDEGRRSPCAFVRGKVTYADGSQAELIYVTTLVVDGLPEDIYGYRCAHPEFPDEPTADQFFDEAQFEAYRELGYRIGSLVCGQVPCESREAFALRFRAAPTNGATGSAKTIDK